MNQENNSYGAKIERGVITQETDGKYIVQSFDRHGLMTPPIDAVHSTPYSAGDRVYFFLLDDGSGKIIGLMNGSEPTGGGAAELKTNDTLIFKEGLLCVNTAQAVEKDNTLPVTSAAVHTTVGNIEILLQTI